MIDENNKSKNEEIVQILAEQLGVEPEDINLDDSFREDLHMSTADLSDFLGKLEKHSFYISNLNINEVETIGELNDIISSKEGV